MVWIDRVGVAATNPSQIGANWSCDKCERLDGYSYFTEVVAQLDMRLGVIRRWSFTGIPGGVSYMDVTRFGRK